MVVKPICAADVVQLPCGEETWQNDSAPDPSRKLLEREAGPRLLGLCRQRFRAPGASSGLHRELRCGKH